MITPSLGFGRVERVTPEEIHIGVRTLGGWLKFESTLGGAENLFEQLGAALGHGLNASGRMRLAELEHLLADAKEDRLRLLALERDLAEARAALSRVKAKPSGEAKSPVAETKIPIEKTRAFFGQWKASGKFLRPFLVDQGELANYQMWVQRFRFRLREEYQAHVGTLLLAHNRNGCPRTPGG